MESIALHTTRGLTDKFVGTPTMIVTWYDAALPNLLGRNAALNDMIGQLPIQFRVSVSDFDWRQQKDFANEIFSSNFRPITVSFWDLVNLELTNTSGSEISLGSAKLYADPAKADDFTLGLDEMISWAWWLEVGMAANITKLRDVGDFKGDKIAEQLMIDRNVELAWEIASPSVQKLGAEWALVKALHPLFADLDGEPDPMLVEGRQPVRDILDAIPVSPWLMGVIEQLMPTKVTLSGKSVTEVRLPRNLSEGVIEEAKQQFAGPANYNFWAKLLPAYRKWVSSVMGRAPYLTVDHRFWRDFFPKAAPAKSIPTSIAAVAAGPAHSGMYDAEMLVQTDGYYADKRVSRRDEPYVRFIDDKVEEEVGYGRRPLQADRPKLVFVPPVTQFSEPKAGSMKSGWAVRTEPPKSARTPGQSHHTYFKLTWDAKYAAPPSAYGLDLNDKDKYYVSARFAIETDGIEFDLGRVTVVDYIVLDDASMVMALPRELRRLMTLMPDGDLDNPNLRDPDAIERANELARETMIGRKVWKPMFLWSNQPEYTKVPYRDIRDGLPVY